LIVGSFIPLVLFINPSSSLLVRIGVGSPATFVVNFHILILLLDPVEIS